MLAAIDEQSENTPPPAPACPVFAKQASAVVGFPSWGTTNSVTLPSNPFGLRSEYRNASRPPMRTVSRSESADFGIRFRKEDGTNVGQDTGVVPETRPAPFAPFGPSASSFASERPGIAGAEASFCQSDGYDSVTRPAVAVLPPLTGVVVGSLLSPPPLVSTTAPIAITAASRTRPPITRMAVRGRRGAAGAPTAGPPAAAPPPAAAAAAAGAAVTPVF